jgi:membrane protein DedA with SNARE-associated domain
MSGFGHELRALEPWLHHYGVAAIFAILVLESLGLPLPGESLLILTAVLAERGDISVPGSLVAAWAGAVIGDTIGYLGGRLLGHTLIARYGGKIGLTSDRIRKVETVFVRYGPMTVIFARFFNVLRQLNGIIAGTARMDWRRFLLFNALGGALWVLVWTSIGLYLGAHGAYVARLLHRLGYLGVVLGGSALTGIVVFIYRREIIAGTVKIFTAKTKGG